ncbi:hypothetical protein FQN55_007274 [Onygenales sp. PD_40]|nr:hypothetical protein FQN55_007274 [Onygenales sp. PD_40]
MMGDGGLGYILSGLGAAVCYLVWLAASRLYWSPISQFPGPKLAALTNWYEFYYDVIQQGSFTFHIQQLHRKYGPIVRITPTELHIDDPEFYEQLYSRTGGNARRDKSPYFASRFGSASDCFSTVHHDLHRLRRKPLSPFFSIQRISAFQPVILKKVEALCQKLSQYKAGEVIPLNRAWMALTTDIITEYAFGKSYEQLESPNFRDTLHEALVAIYTTGHFALHFPIVFPILDCLPDWFVLKMQPDLVSVVGLRKDLGRRVNEIRNGVNDSHKKAQHPTIFHEVLNSDLPEDQKTDARLGDEAQLIVAAGLITTSWALTVGSFHIINNPRILQKLRAELKPLQGASADSLQWQKLELLPYLNGCVHEAIRLAHGITTRNPRLVPDMELKYQSWTIPRNTPVSMTNVDTLMNPDIFPQPDEFVPERWIGNPNLERYFVPFGKGTRQCLGFNLAFAELYTTLAIVFNRFDFELHETTRSDVTMEHAYLVPYPKWESKGVRATVKPRPN